MRRPSSPFVHASRPAAPTPLRRRLDELADAVVRDLERGALAAAWARTRALEREADPAGAGAAAEPVPPAPVIGRRFAAAHRRLLSDVAARDPARAGLRTHPAA
ncbi:MAG TPA: hypothetical protein VK906_15850 [Egicoccus sp.]|nr:hypothetical protein [Egicoccus sp.]HSK24660.1 hypothetical protein [Egicoccus sp.]